MAAGTSVVSVDGAHGEGGGALLRCALAMSALTQQPVKIADVRGGTRHPGLDSEDVTIIRALAESCAADTNGVSIGSSQFSFTPTRSARGINGRLSSVRNESNRGPNALVVLNTLLPVLARSGIYCSVVAEGETYGNNALGYDAFANTTVGALRKMGLYAFPSQTVAGFGRESRGEVLLDVEPSVIQGVDWGERGLLREVGAVVATSRLTSGVAQRAISHLSNLARSAHLDLLTSHSDLESSVPGCFITLWAHYECGFGGAAAMGAKSVRVEALAQSAFEELTEWMRSGACVDSYVSDQIFIPSVLAEGPTTFTVSRISKRLLTCIWVVKQFTPIHVTVKGSEGEPGVVSIRK